MQPGFFDLNSYHQELEKLGEPLPKFAELVDWKGFRPLLYDTELACAQVGTLRLKLLKVGTVVLRNTR